MSDFAEVVSEAMALPPTARADLAHLLIKSLEQDHPEPTENLEETIVSRQQRVQSGNYHAYDAAETLARIKQSLDSRTGS